MNNHKFVGRGIILFVDILLRGAGNWAFWIMISLLTSVSLVGKATVIISLVWLTTSITQLGFEYTLLRFSHNPKSFGTILLLEFIIMLLSIPLFLLVLNNFSEEAANEEVIYIVLGILILSSIGFVGRFALLGTERVSKILAIDIISTSVKFLGGYALVISGAGIIGILIPFLLLHLITTALTLIVIQKHIKFQLGTKEFFKEVLTNGLVNTPSKLSMVIILSLAVVLLAFLKVSDSEIGIFYIALMISYLAGGSFAHSLSYMVIPRSSKSKEDLSSDSLRIGSSITAPIIVFLIVAPSGILSIFGDEYMAGSEILFILSLGILPYVIIMNAISKLNFLNKSKELLILGLIQISIFMFAFWFLVPEYGTQGAAYSILITFVACSFLSMKWLGRKTLKPISISGLAVFIGWINGFVMSFVLALPIFIIVLSSVGISLVLVFLLRNISLKEIREIMKTILR